MKIFCNDYLNNLPQSKHPTRGGPAVFSKMFSDYLVKEKHQWVGLVQASGDTKLKSEIISGNKNKVWWKVYLPRFYINKNFIKIKRDKDIKKVGQDLIDIIFNIITIEKPDIILINGSSCFAWAYLRAASLTRIPIIAVHAGVWSVEIDIYNDFFTPAGIRLMKKMEKDFVSLTKYNVFLNKISKDYFIKNVCKIPKDKIIIIPLPCKSSALSLKKGRVFSDKKPIKIGIVARWDRIKNHKGFLDIVKEAKLKGKNWQFFAVTKISKFEKNKEFAREYEESVKIVGQMNHKKLQNFYKKMDFMLLPSFFETASFVVLEAALKGTPTFISENVGFSGFFREQGASDFIIDINNPKKVVSKIELMKDKRFSVSFTRFLKKTHNPKTVFVEYEKLFKKIYENSRNCPRYIPNK